ncbi:MAG: AraC family transcriptional regulator ligand-binding domain-containing protein [Xanthobacteraceae bacterium]|jgi:AraC-like DNA-binding protein
MGRSSTSRLGLPSAAGAVTRLAYANAKASGVDMQALLTKAGLTLQQINNANLRLRVRDQIKFLNLVAGALNDDRFGFHCAQPHDLREFGFVYYISASSETLGEALQKLARYSAIANEGLSLTYVEGRNVSLTFHYVGVSRHLDRHQIEFFMVFLVRLCRQLSGIRLTPIRIRLAHHRGGQYLEFTKFFGSRVEFGAAVDEVSFAPVVKNMPVVTSDNYLNEFLTAYCEEALARRSTQRGPFRASIENTIVPLLPHGDAKLATIARRLGLSQRTLARRLAAESLNFSDVLENLKLDLAQRYLADKDLSISQVAWLLGYREVSSLTHAFKRWTGRTPRQARSRVVPPISARVGAKLASKSFAR